MLSIRSRYSRLQIFEDVSYLDMNSIYADFVNLEDTPCASCLVSDHFSCLVNRDGVIVIVI